MSDNPAFTRLLNVAAERLGAVVLSCSDDFFAEKENLIKPGRGIFIPDKYTDRGKWMDGWESRRKRDPGHDWCVLKLAAPSIIRGVDVDTNHFLGNHPPFCSIEASHQPEEDLSDFLWTEILEKSTLDPGSQNLFKIPDDRTWTHVKLHIYPDGGVARLKIYGEIKKNWGATHRNMEIDLAAAINGGKSIACNDMFFSHMDNLIMPGKGANMGDGWETKRSRVPDNRDWIIIRLAHPGNVKRIVIDTKNFKGNYPDACSVEGCYSPDGDLNNMDWKVMVSKSKLGPDQEHHFDKDVMNNDRITHIRLNIFPDGGISRIRVFGNII